MTSIKRTRTDAEALDERPSVTKKALQTEKTSAVVSVLGNATLLRLVTSYQPAGLPVLFLELAKKHGITPENVKQARHEALCSGALSAPGSVFEFKRNSDRATCLEELKRMNASYMVLSIQDDDIQALKMTHNFHKQGTSSQHPRFSFRKPMRIAAEYGRLDMLKWLGEQDERGEWLADRWLVDAAFKSCKLDVIQWVHSSCTDSRPNIVTSKALDHVAVHGVLTLLQWALTTFPTAQLTTNAMDGAAANGHLKMVMYLHSERKEGCTTAAMDKAAANGHLAVVEFLHAHRKEGCTVRAMDDAASNGHLDMVKFLHENRHEGCTTNAMDRAAYGGHLDVVRFLYTSRSEGCTETAMDCAICDGHVDVIRYLHQHQCCEGNWLLWLNSAVSSKHLAVVKFACEHCPTDISAESLVHAKAEDLLELIQLFEQYKVDGWTTDVMDHAAAVGCLEAVQYLHSHRSEGCTTRAMDDAAKAGHLDVVKFLHENRSEGCTKRAMDNAAANGALDVVKYLHENRTEGCTRRAIEKAASTNHVEAVQLLLDYYELQCSERAVLNAARGGHWGMLELLLSLNFPADLTWILKELAIGGHLAIIKRLSENMIKLPAEVILEAVRNGDWYLAKFALAKIVGNGPYGFFSFSETLEIASLYGDFDMVELILTAKSQYLPGKAHGFFNTTILGDIELLELLEKARRENNRFVDEPDDDMEDKYFAGSKLNWRSAQMAVAILYGNLEMVMWLKEEHYGHFRYDFLGYCAASDEIDVARYILEKSTHIKVTAGPIIKAVQHGKLRVFKYLYNRWEGKPCRQPLVDFAAGSGSYDLVKFVHECCPGEVGTPNAMDDAAKNDDLDIVRYLHENRSEGCTPRTMDIAATSNSLTVLRFLHAHRTEGCTVEAMDEAALAGNLSVVKFLHENRTEGCTTNAMDHAAESGYLPILKYLHKHRMEGCTTVAMDMAAESGTLLILKWLHEFRDEGCTTTAMDDATTSSHLTIVKFLHQHRSEGCTQRAFDSAIRMLNLDMVKFLCENRKEGYHEAVLEEAVRRDPEDEHLIQQYLLPDELKSKRSRRTFLGKRKLDRLLKRGRFAPERRAAEEEDPYESAHESGEWDDLYS